MVIGASYTDANACRIRYDRGTGASNHVLSLYAGDFTSTGLIGTAPVGTGGAVVQDPATCILDMAHSYVVGESGTGAIVNLALTFKNTGTINTYAQGFDRQNAPGAMQHSSIAIPSAYFSLKPVDPITVQQAGTPVAFTLNVPITGSFTSLVTFAVVAPPGVPVQLQQNPVMPSPNTPVSTTVQVIASPTAAIASGTIGIVATGGGLSYALNIPLSVTPANVAPTPTFALSGPQQISSALQATFTVALTPLNGFPQNDPVNGLVNISVDPFTQFQVTATPLQSTSTVPGSFSVTVAMAPGVTAVYGSTYCALIDVTWNSIMQQELLCINGIANSNFSLPASSQVITVPIGSTSQVYGSFNSSSAPSLTQTATCAAGVTSCNATAAFSTASNGVVPMTLNSGNVPVGTTYTQQFTANGIAQAQYNMPVTVIRLGSPKLNTGTGTGGTGCPVAVYGQYDIPNDGSVNVFTWCTVNDTPQNLNSCTTSSLDPSAVLIPIGILSRSTTNLSFKVDLQAFIGTTIGYEELSCNFADYGNSNFAPTLWVYDGTPVITYISPSTLTPGNNAIVIGGHNFGSNPVVNIAGTNYNFNNVPLSAAQTLTLSLNVTGSPGTNLPIYVTSTGENGSGFIHSIQNPSASNSQSQTAQLPVSPVSVSIQVEQTKATQTNNALVLLGADQNTTNMTATGLPAGGTFSWTVGPKLTIDGPSSQANVTLSGIAPSDNGLDTFVSVTYSVNGQSATASIRVTVVVPTSITSVNFPGGVSQTSIVNGTYSGYLTTMNYQIFEQFTPAVPLAVAGITVTEVLPTLSSTPSNLDWTPPDGQPKTAISNSFGYFFDLLSAAAPGGLPSNFAATRNQVFTLSGYLLVPTNTVTYFLTNATTSVQTMSH